MGRKESDQTNKQTIKYHTWPRTQMGKWHNHKRGQRFPSRWPQGCKKQTRQYDKDTNETQITNRMRKRKHRLGTASKKITGGIKHVWREQPHAYVWCGSRHIDFWFAWKVSNLSIYHLLVQEIQELYPGGPYDSQVMFEGRQLFFSWGSILLTTFGSKCMKWSWTVKLNLKVRWSCDGLFTYLIVFYLNDLDAIYLLSVNSELCSTLIQETFICILHILIWMWSINMIWTWYWDYPLLILAWYNARVLILISDPLAHLPGIRNHL